MTQSITASLINAGEFVGIHPHLGLSTGIHFKRRVELGQCT